MRLSKRLIAFLTVLTALIAAVALVGGNGGAFSTGDLLPPRRGVNLIAYVDLSGQIHTIQPEDPSVKEKITPEGGVFTWPAWSPDATQLAFSGVYLGNFSPGPLTLFISQRDGSMPRVIYTNEPGMGPILNGMPHYPIWSPDGSHLAFMASAPRGLTLYLDDVTDKEVADVVLRNAPLYASWSPDSNYILVHGGVDHFLVDGETGEFAGDFSRRSLGYRTPAWSPSDSSKVALLSQEEGEQNLYISDVESGRRTLIDRISVNAAFLWSPDGDFLAVAESDLPEGVLFQSISIFSPSGDRMPVEVQGNIVAYFWSPDSSRLAYVLLTQTRGVVRLMMLDTKSGQRWPVIEFIPTPNQATAYQFFDQFAHSHSPWSPDSESLVFAGRLRGDASSVSFSQQAVPHIYIVDASPEPTIRSIADGYMAFWSPK
jgi:Tol biopolymer transport system component